MGLHTKCQSQFSTYMICFGCAKNMTNLFGEPASATRPSQEPGRRDHEDEGSPSPVHLPPPQRKRKGKSESRVSKKKKGKKPQEPPRKTRDDILDSFEEEYRSMISSMPEPLLPSNTRHGQHSYTAFLDHQQNVYYSCFCEVKIAQHVIPFCHCYQ